MNILRGPNQHLHVSRIINCPSTIKASSQHVKAAQVSDFHSASSFPVPKWHQVLLVTCEVIEICSPTHEAHEMPRSEYDILLTGAKGRIHDAIESIHISLWDSGIALHREDIMITRPWAVELTESTFSCAGDRIFVEPKSYETEPMHFGKHGFYLAIYKEGCPAGHRTPVMLYILACEARKVDISAVDWDIILVREAK